MKAPAAEQLRLLDLQRLDTQIARANFERRSLPIHKDLKELVERAQDLHRSAVTTQSAVGDTRRELSRAEGDVQQVEARREVQQNRLDAGKGAPKELIAIQHELDQLGRRQGELEESQLEVMERLEKLERRHATMRDQVEAMKAEVAALVEKRDQQVAQIDAQLAELTEQRNRLAEMLPADLLAEYHAVQERTGGVGAVAVRNGAVEGMAITFSPAERASIRAADQDDVLYSEEYEYILVRLAD